MDNPQQGVADILNAALASPEEVTTEETQTDTTQEIEPQEPEKATSETLENEVEATSQDIDTLNNLADELDIPIEDMYALNIALPNADPVSLGELKNFYQENRDIAEAKQQLETERSQIQAEAEKLQQTPPIHPEMIQAQATLMMIQQQMRSHELESLRHSNPAEWAAKQTELKNGYEQASYQLNNINQVIEQKETQLRAKQQQELFNKLPELKDDAKRAETAEQLSGFISQFGFTPNDLNYVSDSRLMHMLIEASKLYQMKGNAKGKRIDTAPKVLKPQAVQNSQAGRKASLKRLTEKARNGQTKDKVSAVNALLVNRG